jgi:ADP-heptose:LPS heptosyltransferase
LNPSILLIRLKSIGDVLFTLPATHAVREAFPDSKITFLTFKQNAPILQGFASVDETFAIDHARYRSGNPVSILHETFTLLRRLRSSQFSITVDFQGYGETAWLSWLSRAPQRWGNVYSSGRRWAYTRALNHNSLIHPVDWNLALLDQCGVHPATHRNRFTLPGPALNEARRVMAALGLDPARPTLLIQPFTSFPPKNWPLDRYISVAQYWRSHGVQILFSAGPSEIRALEPARRAGFPDAAGQPLLITAGLINLSSVTVGGDTGLLHLAVAMDKRVVMIMGCTGPGHAYPYQHLNWALTPPNGKPVSSISPDTVIQSIAQTLP